MITRLIYTEIWSDDFFMELSPDEKLLFIYFLTNERVNIIHLYQCPNTRIKADTGIDTPIIELSKKKFEKAEKMYFKDGYVFLKNAHRYETYSGELNERAKIKLFGRLSKLIIEWYNKITDTPIDTPIYTLHNTETINHNTELINKKSVNSEKDILDILSEKGEKHG